MRAMTSVFAPVARGLAIALVAAAPVATAAEIVRGGQPQAVSDHFVPAPPGVAVADWATGLEVPWSLIFLPDGRALVSERPGRIRLIEHGRLQARPVATFDVVDGGEGGLMGLALDPAFPARPYLYAMLTARTGRRAVNRVIRLRFDGNRATPDRTIVDDIPAGYNHDGGRIAFGPDGMLYVGTGDTFRRAIAQDRRNLGGKILRVTPDGPPAPGNPFPDSPVYSLGHRNVQGLAWHPGTGALFESEHGPSGEDGLRAHDEINVIAKGTNYGWPIAVGAPGRQGLADPLIAWNDRTTPPGGIAFWRGDLFVPTLGSEALVRVSLAHSGGDWRVTRIERWFNDGSDSRYGRLRAATVGPDGALYVLTSNRDGRGDPRKGDDRILRITATGR
jgi:quinoprotein glucose dehydrogenase